MSKIIIIAGPNGAGKTTFAREFLPNEAACPIFVNADLIAAGLSPFAPEMAAVRAERIMLEQIAEHVRRRENFAFETTLSGRGYARRIPEWRGLGYRVELFFLTLPTPESAIERAAMRVRQGGHNVPETVIRRRFAIGADLFERVYKPLVDAWALYDNADSKPGSLIGGNKLNQKPIEQAKTPDLAKSLPALRRAAHRARELARQTGTEMLPAASASPPGNFPGSDIARRSAT
jgi:predicted ABC-type ATPase